MHSRIAESDLINFILNKIMFKRLTGKPNIEFLTIAASTAISNGALLYANGSGAHIPADSTSGNHTGIIMKDIAATDADYASTKKVMCDVPKDDDEFEVDCTGATAALEGTYIDLSTSLVADPSASAKKVLYVTRFISSTKLAVKINAMAANKNVETT